MESCRAIRMIMVERGIKGKVEKLKAINALLVKYIFLFEPFNVFK